MAESREVEPSVLRAVDRVNTAQKEVLYHKMHRHFEGALADKVIAIWGLSFEPRTDDIREAAALVLIERLLAAKASVRVHDPVSQDNVRALYGDRITYCAHHYDTLDGADALAILTEWNEFRNPDFAYMQHKMKQPVIFDGRNCCTTRGKCAKSWASSIRASACTRRQPLAALLWPAGGCDVRLHPLFSSDRPKSSLRPWTSVTVARSPSSARHREDSP